MVTLNPTPPCSIMGTAGRDARRLLALRHVGSFPELPEPDGTFLNGPSQTDPL